MADIRTRTAADGKSRYTARVRIKGHPQQSATFKSLTKCKQWIQNTESAIREGRHFKTNEAKKRTLKDLIEKYEEEVLPKKPRSAPFQAHHLTWWKAQLGEYSLANLSPAMIAECRDKLTKGEVQGGKPRAGSTVNRYLGTLSHVFTVAEREWGWVESNPVRKVRREKEPPGRTRFLTDDERERLLVECKNTESRNLYDIVILALCTGARRSEITGMRWPDVDLERGQVTIRETKNATPKTIPLAGPALEALQQRSKFRRIDSDLVFPSTFEGHETPLPVDIRRPFERAVKRAKIKNFTFHDLRHTCASYLAMNGATPHEIAEVLGHKTLQMVKRYSHLSEAHTSQVVNKMVDAVFGA